MKPATHVAFAENWQPLSEPDRRAEQAFLAKSRRQTSKATGPRRAVYDAMVAETPIAEDMAFDAINESEAQGWWVRPKDTRHDRTILFLHGGGYSVGTAAAYRGLASQLAARTGSPVFVPDYPLAPENPFPAAYDAALAALRWVGRQGTPQVALAGDSAGGGLALALLGKAAVNMQPISAVAVFSPWTDLALTGGSFSDPNTNDPVFQPQAVAGLAAAYLGGADAKDPRASPLYGIPDDPPPIFIQVGQDELLLDDARRYAAGAAARGGHVRLDVYEGLHHVFQRAVQVLPSARRALDDAAEFLSRHWRQPLTPS